MTDHIRERTVAPFFQDAINQVFLNPGKKVFIMDGAIGLGKALPNSEDVLTSTGFAPMGSLSMGDEVIGADGKATKVIGVYPQGIKDIYKVVFADDTEVRCTLDHLWKVKSCYSKYWKVITTQEIIDAGVRIIKKKIKKDGSHESQYRFGIPSTPACEFSSHEELIIDPYVMGALLGDGGFTEGIKFTNHDLDIINEVESKLPEDVMFNKWWGNGAWHCTIVGVKRWTNTFNKEMKRLGLKGKLSVNKHIPNCYKNSNIGNRRELLRGLNDTDGHVLKNGNIEFGSSSKQLIEDYCHLCRSLGIRIGKIYSRIPTYTHKGVKKKGSRAYRVTALQRPSTNKRMVSIEKCGRESATCITVDSSDHLFVTSGFNLTHNSTEFLMRGAYTLAQCVEPIDKNGKMVRESLWAGIRESENSAVATFMQLLEGGIFNPAVMSHKNSPVQLTGSHPRYIRISHALPDETFLDMRIECHGFNNEKAFDRLKSREYLGVLIPEMQAIPWLIIETARERSGRWHTETMKLSKEIDGKIHTLTGIDDLKITLADVNIPERPHPLYEFYYDVPDRNALPYMTITPPEPLLYRPAKEVTDRLREKYPVTRFEGEDTIWYPNPKCYNMTRHFEKQDEDGKKIPWSGYSLWYGELHRTDSEIRRYVLGRPDTVGGAESVYSSFKKDDATVCTKPLNPRYTVYVGFDPGTYAAYEFVQPTDDGGVHYFNEIVFTPEDGVKTRSQLTDYVIRYVEEDLKGFNVVFIPDPAAQYGTGTSESPLSILQELGQTVQLCKVLNQDTESRRDCLGYFMDKGLCTVDPDCTMLVTGLTGGYKRKKLKSGMISNTIDKSNPYSHPVEAAQYPAVNILFSIRKRHGRKNSKRSIYKIRHTPR